MNPETKPVTRVIGFVGWSGAGKTTLITRLIPVLRAQGLRVSTLKHAHHGFDIDQPGKDSYQHREAGASEVLVASAKRFALMHEFAGEPEMPLATLLQKLTPVDLILVEGFKSAIHPKIEVYRSANAKPLIAPSDPHIIAIAAKGEIGEQGRPVVDIDDIEAVAALVAQYAIALETLLQRFSSV